ncbi:hypothetical protein AZ022_005233, partial [Klebsiella pneumoniae]
VEAMAADTDTPIRTENSFRACSR